jgi:hypothetical protein
LVGLVASQENPFTASFSQGDCFSRGDPAGTAIFVKRRGFDVSFYRVVEDIGWLFSGYVVIID